MRIVAMTDRRPTSHSYISQRLRLHYLDWGNTAAQPLVLVHGSQDHCHAWDWLAEALAEAYHVVVPDLRGHGDSSWVQGSSYHQADYLYDLDQLMTQRDLTPAIMISHSMGGTLASLYAGVFPERVRALVIIEGVGLWPGLSGAEMPIHARLEQWINGTRQLAGRTPRRYATAADALGRMQSANPHLSPDQARHLAESGSQRNEDGSYSWKYDNYTHAWSALRLREEDMVALWQRITCPVLILNGTEGYPHRIGQDGTERHFRNAEIRSIGGAGHWAHHDRFDEVQQIVRAFLSRVAVAQGGNTGGSTDGRHS